MRNLQFVPGSLFANRFEIQRTAGSGGMGTVYRATDRYSGDTVALKLLHTDEGHGEMERFAREAQLLSELRHSGIVAHVAHGQTPDGQRFLAMDWLEGQDLGQRLSRGPLPVHDCLRLCVQKRQTCSAGNRPARVKARSPVAGMAERREIEELKPIDEAINQDGERVTGP